MWERMASIEHKASAAVEELVVTKARLAEVEQELATMKREYDLAVSSKQNLVSWKVAKTREIELLERTVRRNKRWEQIDVEALQKELKKAQDQVKKFKNIEEKVEKRAEAIEDRAERRLHWMRRR